MANLRDAIDEAIGETHDNEQMIPAQQIKQVSQVQNDFNLTAEECKFLLSKVAAMDFKGVEIEFVYNLILKLQEIYKNLSNDK